jgi:hypothetical protein
MTHGVGNIKIIKDSFCSDQMRVNQLQGNDHFWAKIYREILL